MIGTCHSDFVDPIQVAIGSHVDLEAFRGALALPLDHASWKLCHQQPDFEHQYVPGRFVFRFHALEDE